MPGVPLTIVRALPGLTLAMLAAALLAAFESSNAAMPPTTCDDEDLASLAGSYGAGPPSSDDVVTFMESRGELLMHPALWPGALVLRRVEADSFVVSNHPEFGATFVRDSDGCPIRARVRGLSSETSYERLGESPRRPVRLLLAGRPVEAARRYVASDFGGADPLARVGRMLLRSAPTRVSLAVDFLDELGRLLPEEPAVHAARGDALIAADERAEAVRAYRRSLDLDPANPEALAALTRLGILPASEEAGWRVPFDLQELFAPPAPKEIAAVEADWRGRDLEPRQVKILLRRDVSLDGVRFEARVVSHRVHGSRHVGVILVPDGTAEGSLPVLIEAKGVSPDFFPLVVPDGLTAPRLLGEAARGVILVAPGFRGERVVIGPVTLTSEGDRSDAWDGATDDLISFLRAAMEVTPEADRTRVCVFGRSRGGTVALLAGIRERQIDCVVSWAAPTDWFDGMGLGGWTQRELVADGLWNRAEPGETGGQFINYFLSSTLAGRHDLGATRLHLIASSPLYFAEALPLSQVHWGVEDAIVPIVNGRRLVERYEASRGAGSCLDARLHPDSGHDQDRQMAPVLTRRFLLGAFEMDAAAVADCRP